MPSEYAPRMLMEPSRHGSIDAELKSLKLLSRRLQSNLTLLATELQLLQRLYYKNKNQHRGALFWRNIAEIRRYLERVANLNLQDSIHALRNTFYGSTETSSGSMKGPWTHFPDQKYLALQGNRYKTAIKMMEKISEVCMRAYKSFHRSLQSAAFIQILLMFAAISSRTRAMSLELQEILTETCNSIIKLLAITSTPSNQHVASSVTSIIPLLEILDDASISIAEAPAVAPSSLPRNVGASVIIERTISKEVHKDKEQTQKMSDGFPVPKKKKRKTTDEIDDIFGF